MGHALAFRKKCDENTLILFYAMVMRANFPSNLAHTKHERTQDNSAVEDRSTVYSKYIKKTLVFSIVMAIPPTLTTFMLMTGWRWTVFAVNKTTLVPGA